MSNHYYNKKFIKIDYKKKYDTIIPLLIRLNIIKYTITKGGLLLIFFQTNKLTKIMRFSKQSESIFLNFNNLKKLNNKTNCTFIVSTSAGIISNQDAISKKIGGKLLFGIIN